LFRAIVAGTTDQPEPVIWASVRPPGSLVQTMGPDTSTQGTQPSDTRAAASRIGFSIWSPGHARLALLIFALAMAVMMLEVTLTRIFSFITFHHMTYLVIGMAISHIMRR
jgi:hypothetical protein